MQDLGLRAPALVISRVMRSLGWVIEILPWLASPLTIVGTVRGPLLALQCK